MLGEQVRELREGAARLTDAEPLRSAIKEGAEPMAQLLDEIGQARDAGENVGGETLQRWARWGEEAATQWSTVTRELEPAEA